MSSEDLLGVYAYRYPWRVDFHHAEMDYGFAHGVAVQLTSPTGKIYRHAVRARRGVQIPMRLLAARYRRKLKRWLR